MLDFDIGLSKKAGEFCLEMGSISKGQDPQQNVGIPLVGYQ